jgi:hypothetical protein
VVRFDQDEGPVKISMPLKPINGRVGKIQIIFSYLMVELGGSKSVFLILFGSRRKKEDKRKKKFMPNSAYKSVRVLAAALGHLFSGLLSSACLLRSSIGIVI